MRFPALREMVSTAIRNHPPECEFEDNAVDKIMMDAQLVPEGLLRTEIELIGWFVTAVQRYEVYCPHEGIDRRFNG